MLYLHHTVDNLGIYRIAARSLFLRKNIPLQSSPLQVLEVAALQTKFTECTIFFDNERRGSIKLDNLSGFKNDDAIIVDDSVEPMRDGEQHAALELLTDRVLDSTHLSQR